MKEGLSKILKQAVTVQKRNYHPYIIRVITRMIDIALIGVAYDNSHLLTLLVEIFDDARSIHMHSRQYPYDPNLFGPLKASDEKWATISPHPQSYYVRDLTSSCVS